MAMETFTVQDSELQNKTTNDESKMDKLVDRSLDLFLHKIRETSQPIPIKDIIIEFKKVIKNSMWNLDNSNSKGPLKMKFLFILPIKGEITLRNGKIWGIDTITRSDDVDFDYNDPVADLRSDFMVANLRFTFDFQFVINRRIHSGNVSGNVSELDSNFGLRMNFDEEAVEITQIELKNIKKLGVDIASKEFAAKLLNGFLYIVTTTSKFAILCITEIGLQQFLGRKLAI